MAKHSVGFFKDEIRDGFYIPTAVKTAWAASLDVLSEIDRICEKYGIKYFADWGSLLGAVRHHGFIPWDDDLDLCMLREDYDRFREVADAELPGHFTIHDYARHENHWLFLSRVVNNEKMNFDPEYLKDHYNFPWLAGVDIFVKDHLYDNEEEEAARDREIMEILACAEGIIEKTLSKEAISVKIQEFNKKYGTDIRFTAYDRQTAVSLYRLAELQMARVKSEESHLTGQIFPWVLKNGRSSAFDSVYYEEAIRMPFEDTTIPVPSHYDDLLKRLYGNYMVPVKVWGGHDYPYFESQKKEMERLLGHPYPAFTFKEEMLERPVPDKSCSLKEISRQVLNVLEDHLNSENISLEEMQQLAIDLGTLTEHTLGENRECTGAVVKSLESFCEALYLAAQGSADSAQLRDSLEKIRKSVTENIINKKEILFLTTGVKEWAGFSDLYNKACKDPGAEVYVVPLPSMTKDMYGNITMSDEEILAQTDPALFSDLTDSLHLMPFTDYDPALHCPDIVYIQNPYDETNPYLTVPAEFYAENLRRYTEELVFAPFGKTAEFGDGDITDLINLKFYVTTPGIVYADKVYVQSENIKTHYVNALCEFAGAKTREYWDNKLTV